MPHSNSATVAQSSPHHRRALVRVPITADAALDAIAAAGLVLYRQISGAGGGFVLAGVDANPDGSLPDVGLPLFLLDADTAGGTYYLASVLGRRPVIDWAAFGRVLYDDGAQVVLRATAPDGDRLAAAGAEVVAIPLEEMVVPLRPSDGRAAGALAVTPQPTVQAMIDQVSVSAVTATEEALTGVVAPMIDGAAYTIHTRHTLSGTPIQKATRYAGARLAARGLTVEYHTWNGATYPNVIGEIIGQTTPGDVVIIGAHLDDMPAGALAPGADDNASGSTAVLLAADIVSQYQWGCTLRFALWTGEEQGLLGSQAYAQRAFQRGETIRAYLNLDMLGFDSSGSGEISLVSRSSIPGSVALMNLFADVVDAYGLDLAPSRLTDDGIGNYSDNASFWTYGYASILAIEGLTFGLTPHYHTTSDTLANLNVPYLTEYVKASLGTFVHLSACLLAAPPTATATPSPTPTATPVPPTPTPTPTWQVSGALRYYAGARPIANATVRMDGPVPVQAASGADGVYVCAGAQPGTNTLTPSKHGDTGGAVSALDAAYVLQRVVGLRTFDAYQTLGCEVTGNGALSALDASLILQRTVGLLAAFPVETACGSEWAFVPVPAAAPNQRLVQPGTSGGCQAGAVSYEPLTAAAAGQDFLGVVFGDCTGNWTPGSGGAAVRARKDAAGRVVFGRGRLGKERLVVPVTIDAEPFHALELELQTPGGVTAVRVRRGPAAAAAALAVAAGERGRLRIALASADGVDARRMPVLHLEMRGEGSAAERLRVVAASVDEGSEGPRPGSPAANRLPPRSGAFSASPIEQLGKHVGQLVDRLRLGNHGGDAEVSRRGLVFRAHVP